MPEREGVKTMTERERRRAYARARVELDDVLQDEDDRQPMGRAARRQMTRALTKQMRRPQAGSRS